MPLISIFNRIGLVHVRAVYRKTQQCTHKLHTYIYLLE